MRAGDRLFAFGRAGFPGIVSRGFYLLGFAFLPWGLPSAPGFALLFLFVCHFCFTFHGFGSKSGS
jgi:hypothetical protein